jgi:SWI/SNF-related matrix-associated actin-dependent regulator of chromatin subfamily A-like protein 1
MIYLKDNGDLYLQYREGEYYAELYGLQRVEIKGRNYWKGNLSALRKEAVKNLLDDRGLNWKSPEGIKIAEQLKTMYAKLYKYFGNKLHSMFDLNGRKLRHHQIDTLMFACTNKYALAALDQGTGKTITTIMKSRYKNLYPTLIVCEASAKDNWVTSLSEQWGFNSFEFTVVYSQRRHFIQALNEKFIIINYDLLHRSVDYLISKGIKHIILDECQRVKSTKTQRYKAVRKIVKALPDAHITFASGTPNTNRADDFFAYLKLANHPLGNNKLKFDLKFLEKEGFKIKGAKNIPILRREMANFMVRYRLEDCWDMPKKNYILYSVKGDGEWLEEYEKEIKRICEEEVRTRQQLENNIHSLNRIISLAKVSIIKETIDNLIEAGKKAVVFGSYTAPLQEVYKLYPSAAYIDGSVGTEKRGDIIRRFRNDERCKVFIGNMRAAGTSIELQNASDVLFLNWAFVPTDFAQAVSRVYRAGQEKPVNIYTILVKDTIDEHIWKLMGNKMEDIDKIIDGKPYNMKKEDIFESIYKYIRHED